MTSQTRTKRTEVWAKDAGEREKPNGERRAGREEKEKLNELFFLKNCEGGQQSNRGTGRRNGTSQQNTKKKETGIKALSKGKKIQKRGVVFVNGCVCRKIKCPHKGRNFIRKS